MLKALYGVLGIVGRWTDWDRYFDLSASGLYRSLFALLICFPALWFVLSGIEGERARLAGLDQTDLSLPLFLIVVGLWVGSFHLSSALIAILMRKTQTLQRWWTVRNWALVWLCITLGSVFALLRVGLPFVVANGVLFAAYLGLLPIDIRIAQRAGGFPFGTAILVACVIVSTSMVVLLIAVLRVLQSGG